MWSSYHCLNYASRRGMKIGVDVTVEDVEVTMNFRYINMTDMC